MNTLQPLPHSGARIGDDSDEAIDAKLANALKSLYTTIYLAAQRRRQRHVRPGRMQQLELELSFD